MVKKAFILAAGLGTRLGTVTRNVPKALVEVNGMPMLEMTIERLKKQGIRQFMVNVHHFSGQVIEFIKKKGQFGVEIEISDESDLLLDTGGAIAKAVDFFSRGGNVLVHNVDIVSEFDLKKLESYHEKRKALVTLCVRKRDSGRSLLFNEAMQLVGWKNNVTQSFKWVSTEVDHYLPFGFSGVYLVDQSFAGMIPMGGKFSIIDAWLKMAAKNTIFGFPDPSTYWFDLGTEAKIAAAEAYLRSLGK